MHKNIVPIERVQQAILFLRGQKVMLDRDLALLYGVETRTLNQAVKRNRARFPADIMFELTRKEIRDISQSVICLSAMKHARNAYAFTEQGVAMLSSVLNSERSIRVNIAIMRAFVQLRLLLASHEDLARKLEELEKKYDNQFRVVFDAIRQLIVPPEPKRKQIGFHVRDAQADSGAEHAKRRNRA
jgi:hypothetical protein